MSRTIRSAIRVDVTKLRKRRVELRSEASGERRTAITAMPDFSRYRRELRRACGITACIAAARIVVLTN
ncbi:MAG: hypothetical protein WA418_29300 [Bradyrhizobium sp.]